MTTQTFKYFAKRHDEMPTFHFLYGFLTFIAAAMLSIGAFGLLIVAHMVLDFIKYREVHKFDYKTTARAIIHENLLDTMLLLLALTVSVYLHRSVELITISAALRIEVFMMYFLGAVLPKFFILEHVLKVFAHVHHYMEYIKPGVLKENFSPMEKFYVVLVLLFFTLLVLAPVLTSTSPTVIGYIVLHELLPFRL